MALLTEDGRYIRIIDFSEKELIKTVSYNSEQERISEKNNKEKIKSFLKYLENIQTEKYQKLYNLGKEKPEFLEKNKLFSEEDTKKFIEKYTDVKILYDSYHSFHKELYQLKNYENRTDIFIDNIPEILLEAKKFNYSKTFLKDNPLKKGDFGISNIGVEVETIQQAYFEMEKLFPNSKESDY